jgi:hypothetical protein
MPFFRDRDRDNRTGREFQFRKEAGRAGLQASFSGDEQFRQAQERAFDAEHARKLKKASKAANSTHSPFVLRNAIIGLGAATVVWCIIVGASFFATRTFLTPLAIILALAIIPIAITTGYTSRH